MYEPPEASLVSLPCAAHVAQSRKGGKCEVGQETKEFCAGVRKTIMARDLLYQYETRTRFSVRLPVLQRTRYMSYTDHT